MQAGPAPLGRSGQLVLAAAGGSGTPMDWARARHWYMVPLNPLLSSVLSAGSDGIVRMAASLTRPVVAPLLVNSAAGGQPILPPAALMMIAAAGVDTVGGAGSPDGRVLLTGVALAALALPGDDPSEWQLECVLDVRTGYVEVRGAACAEETPAEALMLSASAQQLEAPEACAADKHAARAPSGWLRAMVAQQALRRAKQPRRTSGHSAPAAMEAAAGITGRVCRRGAVGMEPAVAAVCQLEARLQLQLCGSPHGARAMAAAIEGCVLAPRGGVAGEAGRGGECDWVEQ